MGVLTTLKEELVKQLEYLGTTKVNAAAQDAIRLALDKAYSYGWYDKPPEIIAERRKGERRKNLPRNRRKDDKHN